MKRIFASKLLVMMSGLLLTLGMSAVATAACDPGLQSCSSSFGVSETYFGSGGELNACSTNYCSKQSAGELGVGNASTGTTSSDHQVQGGFNTNREPYIELTVTAGTTDLGYLSSSSARLTTGTFKVKTYLADGYIVQTQSDPPMDNAPGHHLMNTPSTPTSSAPGTEQFGINLVANTTACGAPTDIGQNPVQIPDSSFSFGTVASGYNQCGKFKYTKGDTIAQSTRSSGETDYTVTYLYNISSATPDGEYTLNHVIVATSTF